MEHYLLDLFNSHVFLCHRSDWRYCGKCLIYIYFEQREVNMSYLKQILY
jgi:hypothetical protein